MSKEPTIFQQHIIDKLRELTNGFGDNIVDRFKVRKTLYSNRIPVTLHNQFLEELVELGYIKIINRKKIEIIVDK